MSKKDRDYTVIIKGCEDMVEAVSTLQIAAKSLNACADSAEATLRDKVSKEDIYAVKNLAGAISVLSSDGKERVLALRRALEPPLPPPDDLLFVV